MYDLIGDVHGHLEPLENLLRELGYREARGAWRHPQRRAVFLGDLVDRGPRIRETVRLVRAMCEAGSAHIVLGNHEWNLLGLCTPDPTVPGAFLRPRNPRNLSQQEASLEQLGDDLPGALEWMRSLPFHLELPGLRVVHACWESEALSRLVAARAAPEGIDDALLAAGHRPGDPLRAAVELVLKGSELTLPPAAPAIVDTDGVERRRVRARWYLEPEGLGFGDYCIPSRPLLRDLPLPAEAAEAAHPYAADAPLLFVGHYGLPPEPGDPFARALWRPNLVCLDFGVTKPDGLLAGYRFDGEATARPDRFVLMPRG